MMDYTSFTLKDWANLTGLFYDGSPFIGRIGTSDFIFDIREDVVSLDLDHDDVKLKFDIFPASGKIYIKLFVLEDQKSGIGGRIFEQHLKMAADAGFSTLECQAAKGTNNGYVGYLVWGLFGFTMTEDYHREFLTQMEKNARPETCLQQLLLTYKGRQFWENHGTKWMATFDLSQNSKNQRIWALYKLRSR